VEKEKLDFRIHNTMLSSTMKKMEILPMGKPSLLSEVMVRLG
jgi:hypothetical protein